MIEFFRVKPNISANLIFPWEPYQHSARCVESSGKDSTGWLKRIE